MRTPIVAHTAASTRVILAGAKPDRKGLRGGWPFPKGGVKSVLTITRNSHGTHSDVEEMLTELFKVGKNALICFIDFREVVARQPKRG